MIRFFVLQFGTRSSGSQTPAAGGRRKRGCVALLMTRNMSPNQEHYIGRLLKSCATFLGRWRGADAVLWELTASHRSLRILLVKGDSAGNLLLSCLDPFQIRGPVRWKNSDLSVSRVQSREDQEDAFMVVDLAAGVEILCGGIEVKENVKLY